MRKIRDEPCVADPRGAPDGRIDDPADPDRRTARALRPESYAEIFQREDLTSEGHALLGPETAHDLHAFGQAQGALLQWHIECVEFGFAIAHAHAEHVAPAGQQIERDGIFGDMHRIEKRHDENVGTDQHPPGFADQVCEHRDRRQHLHGLRDVMVRHPKRREAGFSGGSDLLDKITPRGSNIRFRGELCGKV